MANGEDRKIVSGDLIDVRLAEMSECQLMVARRNKPYLVRNRKCSACCHGLVLGVHYVDEVSGYHASG